MRWFGTSFKQALASAMSVINFGELKRDVVLPFHCIDVAVTSCAGILVF
jgi:hypothetical protein